MTGREGERRTSRWWLACRLLLVLFAFGLAVGTPVAGRESVRAQHGGGTPGTFTAEYCYEFGSRYRGERCNGTFRSTGGTLVLQDTITNGDELGLGDEGEQIPAVAFGRDLHAVGNTTAGIWAVLPTYVAGWFLGWAFVFWLWRPLRSRHRDRSPTLLPVGRPRRWLHAAPWVLTAVTAQGLSMWCLTEIFESVRAPWVTAFAALHAVTLGCVALVVRASRAGVLLTDTALIDRGWFRTRRFPTERIGSFSLAGEDSTGRAVLVDGAGRHALSVSSGLDRDQEDLQELLENWRCGGLLPR